jgi:hypothetical protein
MSELAGNRAEMELRRGRKKSGRLTLAMPPSVMLLYEFSTLGSAPATVAELATLPSRHPGFLARPLVSGALRVRGLSALAGYLPLLVEVHAGKSSS